MMGGSSSGACQDMLTAEFLGEALDSAPDAIVITDTAGRILFANSQVTALLGYQPAEILGEAIDKIGLLLWIVADIGERQHDDRQSGRRALAAVGNCLNGRMRIDLVPLYRCDKAVAAPGNRLDAAPLCAVPIEHAAQS